MRKIHRLDLAGHSYGRWQVIELSHSNQRGEKYWLCRCQCGAERAVKANSLRNGRSTSCGCHHKDAVTSHGMTGTPTFKSWESMKQRCLNPNSPDYHNYGGRGVKVHGPWVNSFEQFLADMGERPLGTSLDREDNEGDYTPANCRWANQTQQVRNRRDAAKLTHNGLSMSFHDWAAMVGLPAKVIKERIRNGWDAAKALSTPVNPNLRRTRRRE